MSNRMLNLKSKLDKIVFSEASDRNKVTAMQMVLEKEADAMHGEDQVELDKLEAMVGSEVKEACPETPTGYSIRDVTKEAAPLDIVFRVEEVLSNMVFKNIKDIKLDYHDVNEIKLYLTPVNQHGIEIPSVLLFGSVSDFNSRFSGEVREFRIRTLLLDAISLMLTQPASIELLSSSDIELRKLITMKRLVIDLSDTYNAELITDDDTNRIAELRTMYLGELTSVNKFAFNNNDAVFLVISILNDDGYSFIVDNANKSNDGLLELKNDVEDTIVKVGEFKDLISKAEVTSDELKSKRVEFLIMVKEIFKETLAENKMGGRMHVKDDTLMITTSNITFKISLTTIDGPACITLTNSREQVEFSYINEVYRHLTEGVIVEQFKEDIKATLVDFLRFKDLLVKEQQINLNHITMTHKTVSKLFTKYLSTKDVISRSSGKISIDVSTTATMSEVSLSDISDSKLPLKSVITFINNDIYINGDLVIALKFENMITLQSYYDAFDVMLDLGFPKMIDYSDGKYVNDKIVTLYKLSKTTPITNNVLRRVQNVLNTIELDKAASYELSIMNDKIIVALYTVSGSVLSFYINESELNGAYGSVIDSLVFKRIIYTMLEYNVNIRLGNDVSMSLSDSMYREIETGRLVFINGDIKVKMVDDTYFNVVASDASFLIRFQLEADNKYHFYTIG